MNKNNNSINLSIMMFLILSLLVIVPMNIGIVYGADEKTQMTRAESTCGASFNPKGSLIMSIITLCLPGLLDKMMEWKEIKCKKVVCKYDAIKNGLDSGFCDKQNGYEVCTYIVGEMFAIPPMNIIKHIKDIVKGIIANPIGILYSAALQYSRLTLQGLCKLPICILPPSKVMGYAVLGADIAGLAQLWKELSANGFGGEKSSNSCGRMGEIKKEMEEIVEAQSGDE